MVIKSSAVRDISRLVAELASEDEIRREAAIARLAIIGPRAVTRLLDALGADPPAPARTAILRALEAIGDRRALGPALERLTDSDPRTAVAAVAVVRSFLRSDDRETAARALEGLTAIGMDRRRPEPVRLAAHEALDELYGARAAAPPPGVPEDASLEQFLARLPDDPEAVRAAIQTDGETTPLGTLGHLVEMLRDRESAARRAEERAAWRAARGAAHQVLAARGSRVMLYDLRETLAAASEPLPVGFLAAVTTVGDESCLEALAGAWSKAKPGGDWWRRQLGEAFKAIVRRERLTRRSAAVRRALARWPDAEVLVSTPSRTTPRQPPAGRT
jgi:HEAT repeat protein